MSPLLPTLILRALLLLPQGAVPQVVLPPPSALSAAQRDEAELERLATRLGPARLLAVASSAAGRGQRLAALKGLGLSGGSHPELAGLGLLPLCGLLSRLSDIGLLEAGAEAARRMAQALGHGELHGEERDGDELPQAAQALLRLAADESLTTGVRAELLLAATALPGELVSAQALVAMARRSPAPVRRVALDGLGLLGVRGQQAELIGLATALTDDELAVAAAATLCEIPALPLSVAVAERVRLLAAPQGGQTLETRQKLTTCLRRLGTPADRALLAQLRRPGRPGRPGKRDPR